MTLYERLVAAHDGDKVPVKSVTTGLRFTIQVKAGAGIRGYGVIPDGKARVNKNGHMLLTRDRLEEWTDNLEAA